MEITTPHLGAIDRGKEKGAELRDARRWKATLAHEGLLMKTDPRSRPGVFPADGSNDKMILAHCIALDPTTAQAVYFARACGTARFAWNWALAEWQRQYKDGGKPNECALRRQLNAIKREQFPWMLDVSKTAPQQAIRNLGTAFANFFRDIKKPKALRKAKYPRFKRKGERDSFRADNGAETFAVSGKRIKLPCIGWVRMRENLRFKGEVRSVTISRIAQRWFASITVEIQHEPPERVPATVGVDLGVKTLATLSDGTSVKGPKSLIRNLKKLRRLSRALSRKVKGSANRNKARQKLARLHARIANIRKDALHKLTTGIVKRFTRIGIEDLNVDGMRRNRRLARSISDVGMYEFRRQLEYKAAMYGSEIIVAGRWYPSSKTCSDCGTIRAELPLSIRAWACEDCGSVHDRDINAAINLERLAASSAVSACGEESSDNDVTVIVKLAPVKQELRQGIVHA